VLSDKELPRVTPAAGEYAFRLNLVRDMNQQDFKIVVRDMVGLEDHLDLVVTLGLYGGGGRD
jgi:hypothetical protein